LSALGGWYSHSFEVSDDHVWLETNFESCGS
jgi:hypothetical protein